MADWKTYIGDNNGSLSFLKQEIVDGGITNENYIGTINMMADLVLPEIKTQLANTFGIFDNTEEKKAQFYKRIKSEVFRLDASEYFFNVNIYYNPSLNALQVLQYLREDDLLAFLSHPDTLQMTDVNATDFLNYFL